MSKTSQAQLRSTEVGTSEDPVVEVSAREVLQLVRAGEVRFFEFTDGDGYLAWHIPGAVRLTVTEFCNQIAQRVPDIDTPIICYGYDGNDWRSRYAALFARVLGYRNSFWYRSGKRDWLNRRLAMESFLYRSAAPTQSWLCTIDRARLYPNETRRSGVAA